jgi:uncharacterized membrane protein YfhO
VLNAIRQPGYDPYAMLYLEKEPSPGASRDRPLKGTARIAAYENDSVIVDVSSNKSAILLLPENYADGWRAEIDGCSVEVIRANAFFRAVAVPEGQHRVKFYYLPGSVIVGALFSSAYLLMGVCFLLFPRLRSLRLTLFRESALKSFSCQ